MQPGIAFYGEHIGYVISARFYESVSREISAVLFLYLNHYLRVLKSCIELLANLFFFSVDWYSSQFRIQNNAQY